ncbi:MAG: glycosyltransferase family 4 protein [Anaerolineales bacterium]|nr:glycosyltransferase family 4 protein [Anaerolineales bacterium]
MMKILHMVYNRTGQGSYWRAYHFGRELVRRGHQVTLVSTSASRRFGIQVKELDGMMHAEMPDLFRGPLRSGWDPWNALNRIWWLRKRQFDLVYAIETRPTQIYPALYLHRIRKIPLILGWSDWFGRGGSVEQRPNPVIRFLLRNIETYFEERFRGEPEATTAICSTLYNRALELGVAAESLRLIPDGSDADLLTTLTIAEARAQAGLPQETLYLGYVGSIFKKDAILMAEAFDRVIERCPQARLLIIGYCPLDIGQLSKHPQAIIQTGRVSQADLVTYLAACDIFWLPLRNSNANRGRWPHKLNDYMAIGRPTVATAVGDVVPLMEAEPIGLLSPDQPEPFAEQTLQLITDPQRRAQMGNHARTIATTRFSWERLTDEMETLYQEAIERFEQRQK